ncbi:MAG: hypothetical protein M1834_001375 [Cirrosporium novae-zelandiae]|nr:MAG: hypothetical protein M1834_001375 [Cirrosporium novae-zelandiae]
MWLSAIILALCSAMALAQSGLLNSSGISTVCGPAPTVNNTITVSIPTTVTVTEHIVEIPTIGSAAAAALSSELNSLFSVDASAFTDNLQLAPTFPPLPPTVTFSATYSKTIPLTENRYSYVVNTVNGTSTIWIGATPPSVETIVSQKTTLMLNPLSIPPSTSDPKTVNTTINTTEILTAYSSAALFFNSNTSNTTSTTTLKVTSFTTKTLTKTATAQSSESSPIIYSAGTGPANVPLPWIKTSLMTEVAPTTVGTLKTSSVATINDTYTSSGKQIMTTGETKSNITTDPFTETKSSHLEHSTYAKDSTIMTVTVSPRSSSSYNLDRAFSVYPVPDLASITQEKKKRKVPTMVTATIDGQVVSWTNNWPGYPLLATSSASSTDTCKEGTPTPTPVTSASTSLIIRSTMSYNSSSTSMNTTAISITTATTFSTSATSLASVASTSCGLSGKFTIDFDDLPSFSPANNDTADFPPIFNPYDHFYFSGGFAYVPPPTDPYLPFSPPHLAVYTPNGTSTDTSSPDAGLEEGGELGAGPRDYETAYWFNVYSAYLGCDNPGPDPCTLNITGLKYDAISKSEVILTEGAVELPPCPGVRPNCSLVEVAFGTQYQMLSGLRIRATVPGLGDRMWYLDNLELEWWNNTCAAGLERESEK